jgi:lipopolysaccharide export system permease protein
MSIVYELPAVVGAVAPSLLFTSIAVYYIRK